MRHMTPNIYILSGLGADERVFQQIDFTGANVSFITWVPPTPDESIESYSARLIEQITVQKPILVGLSFGGIMAVEIAKHIGTEKVVLIASVKTRNEIPFYYRWTGALGLHKLIPACLLKQSNIVTNWFFGAASESARNTLKHILRDTDPMFLKWAIHHIVRWKNTIAPSRIIHIHGTADRILPVRFVAADIRVRNGGHFMVWNQPAELADILSRVLQCPVRNV